ncbi:tuftelin-interacting protein 11-like [Sphaerodactylus townsendi]|uniref:tuftelin-interacting protein 11-like n=1 Tax=Sphaerodactylus townsendi TaxID=933632 RepID=UPI00202610E8|nr:tuftelin-interacting protein 11-like [Sphaerodactylus townsendi]
MDPLEVIERDLQQDEFSPPRQTEEEEALYGTWAPQRRPGRGGDPRPALASSRSRSQDDSAPGSFVRAGLEKSAPGGAAGDEEPPQDLVAPKKRRTGGPVQPRSQQRFAGAGPESWGGLGGWERHTRGIGQRLLRKMGHVPGRGLGKGGQGILRPLEARPRRGRGGVGAYGSERAAQPRPDFFPGAAAEGDAEKKSQKEEFGSQWREEPRGGQKKTPKTVEGLEAQGWGRKHLSAPPEELARVKVTDVTSWEQKVHCSRGQIGRKPTLQKDKDPERPAFALPELEHNLQLLLDLAGRELLQNGRQLQRQRHVVATLSHEMEKVEEVLSHAELEVHRLGQALEMVEEGERRLRPGCGDPLSLAECAEIFETLRGQYYEECRPPDRVDLAAAVVFPLVKEYFKNWDCTLGTEVLGQGKRPLESHQLWSHGGQDPPSDAFQRLVWEAWMPQVQDVLGQWQPRNCAPMVDFLDSWGAIIPTRILDHVLDHLVFPKLQEEVESWDPLTDPVPVHSWLHPWLPLMQARLEPLYPPVRRKLASALQKWHPRDPSAKRALQPWKDVFTPGPWEAFMLENIVPKLGLGLDELPIDPHHQQQHTTEAFFWVLDWEGLIPPSCLAGLLERHFFPRWLQALRSWLSNDPNYEEVAQWYLGWKARFSDQLLAHPSIKEKFNQALGVMSRATSSSSVGGYLPPGAQGSIAYLARTERRKDFVPLNFKDLVQTKAEEHNMVFMPLIRKRHEGRQLYAFGRAVIYIDRGVVFVLGGKTWVPTSLQSLLDMAK